ncbi:MAG: BatA domain-containing protein [Victivallales bacterium]
MQFGNTMFLWGLLALPIPLVIHLYFRRNRVRVKFSTIQFFRKRERFLSFRRKLRDFLLLFLRTLAVLFLVLALARPSIGGFKYLSGGSADAVIIIDDTLSMCRKNSSGDTAYACARKKAQEIADALGGGDSAAVIFLSGRRGVALTQSIRKADDAIKNSIPSGCGGSYSAGFRQASEYIRASMNPNHEIFLISDFQSCQAPSQPYRDGELKDSRIYFVAVSGTQENISVTRVSTGSKPKTVNRAMRVEYDVENFGKAESRTELNFEVNGRTIETRDLALPGGEKKSGEFSFVPVSEGVVYGSVGVKDEPYGMDNRRYFAVSVSKNVRVLAVYEDEFVKTDPYFFIKHALDPDGTASNGISIQTATVKELTAEALSGTHVVILADIDSVPEKYASLIADYLKKGGSVVSLPGSRTKASSMSGIADALKKDSISVANAYGGKVAFKKKGIMFSGDLAIMNDLLQLDYLEWKDIQELSADPSAEVLATASGKNVILERKAGNGRWIALACSARNDYCNWPELKSFPVMMVHLVDHAANGMTDIKSMVCGNKIPLVPSSNSIDVSKSSGSFKLSTVKGRAFSFEDTWVPGVITFDGADIRAAVLNGDSEESRPEILPHEKMLKSILDHDVNFISADSTVAEQVDSSRKGNSLAGLFLVLLFCAALMEFLISDNHLGYFNPSASIVKGGKT